MDEIISYLALAFQHGQNPGPENLKTFPGAMAEPCQKPPVVFEIDTDKNTEIPVELPKLTNHLQNARSCPIAAM
ncbi:MAG: hypothetical protein LWX01_11990 [Deltaproteobacteria bacterium]|nr:hypothetical protein [Deltaproteobacteria bacterium]MDL1962389.1 hypothetical protein [Deltaproteobacteria bacterium]